MAVNYSWILEGRIVHIQVIGQMSTEEMQNEDAVMQTFFNKRSGPLLHVLIDETQMTALPDLKTMFKVRWIQNPDLGWFIMYGVNERLESFKAHVATSKYRVRFAMVDTLNEALDLLQERDLTLPDLKPLKTLATE